MNIKKINLGYQMKKLKICLYVRSHKQSYATQASKMIQTPKYIYDKRMGFSKNLWNMRYM